MVDKTLAVAGLARDCEGNLPNNLLRIEQLRARFKESFVFFYENNSRDTTKKIIRDYAKNHSNVFYISEDITELQNTSPSKLGKMYRGISISRINKMCECRNKLLNLIKEHCAPDYVVFVDADVYDFSIDGIESAIKNAPDGWGGLFANSYTQYTYRGELFTTPLCVDTYAFWPKGKDYRKHSYKDLHIIRRHFLARKMYDFTQRNSFYECDSAFGGIGIYNYSMIKDLNYHIELTEEMKRLGVCLCEHIYFNKSVCGAKYISRDIKVCYDMYDKSGIKGFIYNTMPRTIHLFSLILGYFS